MLQWSVKQWKQASEVDNCCNKVMTYQDYLPSSSSLVLWLCIAYLCGLKKVILIIQHVKRLCDCRREVENDAARQHCGFLYLISASLTSAFLCCGQHLEDAHSLVAFVNAPVFHLLDVRQRIHCTAEVGFPCLWVTCLTLNIFPCRKHIV